MGEDIRKQGILFLQQQRFGKKWKRVWCVLYRESVCSISRLEYFECKDGGTTEKNDKTLRKQQEHKKVIRLSDCIRVSEVEMDGCPRDTGPFLVETTEKLYVFASDRAQMDDWTHKLCEIAFPMSWTEGGVKRRSLHRGITDEEEEVEGMEDNSLYSGRETVLVRDFRVSMRRSEAADRCRLRGAYVLRADVDNLLLMDAKTSQVLYSWPYRYLRRFGRDKVTFSFEAGRRCDSGEGSFEFDTKQGNQVFQAVEAAISLQRSALPPNQGGPDGTLPRHRTTSGGAELDGVQHRSLPHHSPIQDDDMVYSLADIPGQTLHLENSSPAQHRRPSQLSPPVEKVLTGMKSLTLDTRGAMAGRKTQVKTISSCPLPHSSPDQDPEHVPHHQQQQDAQGYSQITMPGHSERDDKRERREKEKRGERGERVAEAEYSLPFDTIANNVMEIFCSHQAFGLREGPESGADPLYDCIDESQVKVAFRGVAEAPRPTYKKVEHIYDEPEGCAVIEQNPKAPTALYDDPEEMRGNAWRSMGSDVDPKGQEYTYDPRVDDYAVPKRPQRAFPDEEQEADSPYDNVNVKERENR